MISALTYCKLIQNKYILMKNQDSFEKQQTQDDIITAIRNIATQIFDENFSKFQHLNGMGFRLSYASPEDFDLNYQTRKHSYTQRKKSYDRSDCQSQWINYEDFEKRNKDFQTKVCSLQGQIPSNKTNKYNLQNNQSTRKQKNAGTKNIEKNHMQKNKITIKNQNNKNEKNNKQKTKNEKIQENMVLEQKQKIKLQNLQQYGFMKQTKKLKKQIIQDIYRKQKSLQQQNIKPKKNFKTLQQLYEQKQPLYDKYLKDKQKKLAAIYQSRIASEKDQLQYQNSTPDINKNLPVEGNFQYRLKKAQKKAQQNKIKIINEIMNVSPFQPQLNSSKKYQRVQSKIKKTWSQKSLDICSFYSEQIKNSFESQKIPQLIVKNTPQTPKNRTIDFRLKSTTELSNILEIQDNLYE